MDNNSNSGALQKTWKVAAMGATKFFGNQMYQPRQSKKRYAKSGVNKEQDKDVDYKFKEIGKEVDFNA